MPDVIGERVYEMHVEEGEIVHCDSCEMDVPTADYGSVRHPSRRLCEFCAHTMAGRHTEKPNKNAREDFIAEIWKAAASVYNMLQKGKMK